MTRAGAAGLALSLALHAGLAGLLAWRAVPPEPETGKRVEAKVQMTAASVPRSRAAPSEPGAEAAGEARPEPGTLGAAAIPRNRAKARDPQGERARSAPSPATRLAAVADSAAAGAGRLAARSPAGAASPAQRPEANTLAAQQPDAAQAEVRTPASGAPARAEPPRASALSPAEPRSEPAPATGPDAPALNPDGTRAELARQVPGGEAADRTRGRRPDGTRLAARRAEAASARAASTPEGKGLTATDAPSIPLQPGTADGAALDPARGAAMDLQAAAARQASRALGPVETRGQARLAQGRTPAGTRLGTHAARAETAARLSPDATRLAATATGGRAAPQPRPTGTSLDPARTSPRRAPRSEAQGPRLAAAQMPGAALSPRPGPSAPARRSTPGGTDLTAADPEQRPAPRREPAARRLPGAAPDGLRTGPGDTAATAQDMPAIAAARVAAPAAEGEAAAVASRARAGLAWAGGAGARFDPLSLATVQSFMGAKRAQDSALHTGGVRDAISQMLSDVPCSRLQAAFVPETGALEIRGHVPRPALRGEVEDRLSRMIGAAIGVGNDLLHLPRPQCAVLSTVARLGLPQSSDQANDPLVVGEAAQTRIVRFTGGERLTLTLQAPDYPAYVYLDYYDSAGNVIHLIPNRYRPLARHAPGSEVRVGAPDSPLPERALTFAPPYGRDIAVSIATSVPLHDGLRPMVERAGPYLDWLAERLERLRADGDARGEWVYLFIDTTPPDTR